MSAPDPEHSAPGEETRRALADVLEDQGQREARRSVSRAPLDRTAFPGIRVAAVAVLSVLATWLWLAPPAALMPDPPPPPSIESVEAGLRMDMWTLAASVEEVRRRGGALPASLEAVAESPEDTRDIRFLRLGGAGRYRLVGERGGVTVLWTSTEGLDALVADAPQKLGRDR